LNLNNYLGTVQLSSNGQFRSAAWMQNCAFSWDDVN